MNWMQILFLVVAALVAWFGFRFVRNNPSSFSKESLGKSFHVTAVLALLLIAFIAVLVLLLRGGS